MDSEPASIVVDYTEFLYRKLTPGIAKIRLLCKAQYVPISDIRDYLTPDVIRDILISQHMDHLTADCLAIRNNFLVVFTILACIREIAYLPFFLKNNLGDMKLPFLCDQDWGAARECCKFFDNFANAQWKFCAQSLASNQPNNFRIPEKVILPIQILETLKNGPNSFTYIINIDPAYTDVAGKAYTIKDGKLFTNVFVLKTCPAKNTSYHNREVAAYNVLASREEAMKYLARFYGSWTHSETYCMLLEYVEGGTLTELLERDDPPTHDQDIRRLWEGMLGLSKLLVRIHSLGVSKYDEYSYLQGIHHDIKPDNILVTTRDGLSNPECFFKLVDLGLTDFERVTGEEATSRDFPSTQMFAAPEYCVEERDLFDMETLRKAKPAKDIWSFGCVLSLVATWAGLGKARLDQYRKDREKETNDNPMLQQTAYSGCFHDSKKMLQAVQNTHIAIQNSRRQNDHIIVAVLHLIEEMLEEDESIRPKAQGVYRKMKRALEKAETQWKPCPVKSDDELYPPVLQTMSDRMQPDELPTEVPSTGLGVRWSPAASPTIDTMPSGPYPATRSHSISHGHTTIELVDPSPRQPSTPHPNIHNVLLAPSSDAISHIETPHSFNERLQQPESLQPSPLNSPSPQAPTSQSTPPHIDTTTGMVTYKATESDPKKIREKTRLPEMSISDVEQWIRDRKRRSVLKRATNDLPDHGWLRRLNGKDQIFLIDDSGSMKLHWLEVKRAFKALGYLVKQFDPDGIEIRFTNDPSLFRQSKNRKPLKALLKNITPSGQCDIGDTLSTILKNLHPTNGANISRFRVRRRKKERGAHIYVLTDGVWEGGNHWLPEVVKTLKALEDRGVTRKVLGIQFVQFGNDAEGTKRLRALDDTLSKYGVKEDFIDTEPISGNVFKILFGATDPVWDNYKPPPSPASASTDNSGTASSFNEKAEIP